MQANAKLLRAPEDAAQAVVLCDLSNSRWWSILYSNTPFAAVAGVPTEALVDNSFWKLFRPANNEAKVQYLVRPPSTTRSWQWKVCNVTPHFQDPLTASWKSNK